MLYLHNKVLHGHSNSRLGEIKNFEFLDWVATFRGEDNLEFSGLFGDEVCASVLVSEGVTTDDDGLFPLGDEEGDVFAENRLSENCAVEVVSDGAVGGLPHLFQVEFLDSGLVRSDCGAFDSDLKLI